MSITVEKLDGLQRKLVLNLPWQDIETEAAQKLKATQRRARVDGFRPGKAPLRMIESMYGASIRDEIINEQIRRRFAQTASEQGLKLAGVLSYDALEEQDDKEVLKIAATFEVFPEIRLGDLSELSVEKTVSSVGDEEVEKTITILRQQRTRFNRVEREARDGDRVIIDFAGKIDGEAFEGGSSQNYPFVLGQGRMLPEFETGVLGMKEGDVKQVEVSFPEDYHGKDVAGKTAVFTITLHNVAEAVLPEIDEAFAKSLGIADGNVETMRAEIRKNVEREIKRRTEGRTKENVMKALLDGNPTDVPSILLNEEAERLAAEMRQNFANQGMDVKDLNLPADMFQEQAKSRVALGLILAELVSSEKLEPNEEQIKAVVAEFAESYEDPQEVVEWYFADQSRLQGPTSLAVEANVVNHVLSRAKVSEKTLSFDEIMNQQA